MAVSGEQVNKRREDDSNAILLIQVVAGVGARAATNPKGLVLYSCRHQLFHLFLYYGTIGTYDTHSPTYLGTLQEP